MKMIEAIIKPQKLEDVKNALGQLGILGATAIEVKGFGRQLGHTERYRGSKMDIAFVPKILLQIVVKTEDVEKVVKAVADAARTGAVGDGKIFVLDVDKAVRIRTGETDQTAL